MIDRVSCGLMPDKPHTVLRDADGNLLYEEMITRGGFSGAFTYLYHRHQPTPATKIEATRRGHAVPVLDEAAGVPLKRRLYDTRKMAPGGTAFEGRVPLLFNADLAILLRVPDEGGRRLLRERRRRRALVRPGGHGAARVGVRLAAGQERRLRLDPEVDGASLAPDLERDADDVLRGARRDDDPNDFRNPVGQLKMDAPYTHRDFVRPEGPIASTSRSEPGPEEIVIKKRGAFTRVLLERPPMDVVGWDGFVYPWAFPIEKYQPKTGLVHLPPTIHTTFAGPGFLVCSFVPRLTDTHPQAIPCPYPHSSVDCDEVILYLRGNFTSRRGVGPGAISLHPAGIGHGPHPGAYEASIGATRTDEMAVMVDTYLPLSVTAQAANIEDAGYQDSWKSHPTSGAGKG